MAGKKTVLRSIRISQENADLLEQEARRKGLSFNALISTLVAKYVEWDRYADRFGFIMMTHEGHKNMLTMRNLSRTPHEWEPESQWR